LIGRSVSGVGSQVTIVAMTIRVWRPTPTPLAGFAGTARTRSAGTANSAGSVQPVRIPDLSLDAPRNVNETSEVRGCLRIEERGTEKWSMASDLPDKQFS
jgi:hypothetical protein